jgi:anti-sigma factor RsiW
VSPDLETVMAYVDGELPPQRRLEVEAAIAADAQLAATVEALYASRLPYQSAFAGEPVPPVPQALQAHVAELSAVATASHDMALAAAANTRVPGGGRNPGTIVRTMLVLLLGLLAGYLVAAKLASAGPGAEPWVMKVSNYHAMYSRETVMDGGSGITQTRALQSRLREQRGLDLVIPDLRSEGLQFVRAQQLQFEGRMVLQLVYLPKDGLPLALCLTQAAAQAERAVTLDGLQAVTWHAKGWAYVIVGALPMAQMQSLRKQLPAALI